MFSSTKSSRIFVMSLLAFKIIPSLAYAIAGDVSDTTDAIASLTFQGTYYDGGTDHWFDLYSPIEDNLSSEDALESYWTNFSNDTSSDTSLAKRGGFFDCNYTGNHVGLKTWGCGTAHTIGAFVVATGAGVASSYIRTVLNEAFASGRDNKDPRSICITKDGDELCISWASYDSSGLRSGEASSIASIATTCGQKNGSSEFKAELANGSILFICVSDRADGCQSNVCGVD